MSVEALIAAVWLLGPVTLLCLLVAACEWFDRRAWREDERRLAMFVALEQSWELPPAERRRA